MLQKRGRLHDTPDADMVDIRHIPVSSTRYWNVGGASKSPRTAVNGIAEADQKPLMLCCEEGLSNEVAKVKST